MPDMKLQDMTNIVDPYENRFSCPVTWSVKFMSCNFMPYNFDRPSFSCPSFSAPSMPHQTQTISAL